jgi:hypothetical protein
MDTRKKYEELVKRPVPDETMRDSHVSEDDRPTNNANPNHREDFKSLATLAARKRERED